MAVVLSSFMYSLFSCCIFVSSLKSFEKSVCAYIVSLSDMLNRFSGFCHSEWFSYCYLPFTLAPYLILLSILVFNGFKPRSRTHVLCICYYTIIIFSVNRISQPRSFDNLI